MVLRGTAGNDTIIGFASDDVINGGDGQRDIILGQDGDDTLDGGDGIDYIFGGNGDDTLRGGDGSEDFLYGNSGDDTYVFETGFGADTINNYDTQADGVDVAHFEDVSIEDLWFSRSGNNLQITVAGTDDQVTVSNWYSNTHYQLDSIEAGAPELLDNLSVLSNPSVLLNNQVEQLVSAMASYSVPSGAGNVIPQDVKDELQSVITAAWQTT